MHWRLIAVPFRLLRFEPVSEADIVKARMPVKEKMRRRLAPSHRQLNHRKKIVSLAQELSYKAKYWPFINEKNIADSNLKRNQYLWISRILKV